MWLRLGLIVYGNGTIFKFLLTALMVTESLSTIVQGQNYDLECIDMHGELKNNLLPTDWKRMSNQQ